MAIASRFMDGARADDAEETIRYRSFGNQFFTYLVNLIFARGWAINDTINGFRAIRRDKFLELNTTAKSFAIEYQMTIRAIKLGYRIEEIPTKEMERIGGESTAYSIPVGLSFIRTILSEIWIGKGFKNGG